MDYSELPHGKIKLERARHPGWNCSKCHWRNPTITTTCGNCHQPRKEEPCPAQETTMPETESTAHQNS